MKKKSIVLMLTALLLIFGLCACGKKSQPESSEITDDYNLYINDECICAAGFVGYFTEDELSSATKQYAEANLTKGTKIIASDNGNQAYLIIPKYKGTKVTVSFTNSDGKEKTKDAPADTGFFLITDATATVTFSYNDEEQLSFQPSVDTKSGVLNAPEQVWDITYKMLAVG